jgi:hypothetical protein
MVTVREFLSTGDGFPGYEPNTLNETSGFDENEKPETSQEP